jgi:hypothetical protein
MYLFVMVAPQERPGVPEITLVLAAILSLSDFDAGYFDKQEI